MQTGDQASPHMNLSTLAGWGLHSEQLKPWCLVPAVPQTGCVATAWCHPSLRLCFPICTMARWVSCLFPVHSGVGTLCLGWLWGLSSVPRPGDQNGTSLELRGTANQFFPNSHLSPFSSACFNLSSKRMSPLPAHGLQPPAA